MAQQPEGIWDKGKSGEEAASPYADVKTSKRALAEEEVTGAEPLNGEGDGFRAQMQEPGFARRGMPPVVSGGKRAGSRGRKGLYLGQKMRASPFLSHLHLHRWYKVSKHFARSTLCPHVCSGYHRERKLG